MKLHLLLPAAALASIIALTGCEPSQKPVPAEPNPPTEQLKPKPAEKPVTPPEQLKKPDAPPAPAPQTEPAKPTETPKTPAPTTEKKGDSIQSNSTMDSVINYGTGATQLKIKKKETEKIKELEKTENQKLEDALNDTGETAK